MTSVAPTDHRAPRVRAADRADLLAVYRIEQSVFPQPWPFAALEGYLDQPGFLVADCGPVVGYVVADAIETPGARLGHIKDLAVRPDRRREGIGTRLLEGALTAMGGQGVSAVKLEVREGNEAALSLYRDYGFVHRRTIPQYYGDGEDALVLVRG